MLTHTVVLVAKSALKSARQPEHPPRETLPQETARVHTAARNRATPAVCIADRKPGSESPSSHLILAKQRAGRKPASRNQPQQPRPQPRAAASIPRPCVDNNSPVVHVSHEQTPADAAHDSSGRVADSIPRTKAPSFRKVSTCDLPQYHSRTHIRPSPTAANARGLPREWHHYCHSHWAVRSRVPAIVRV